MNGQRDEIRIFVSYSHLDREWFAKLQPLLKFKVPTHSVHVWHDQELRTGDLWDHEIRAALDQMDIFVCLVSNHFLASDYITDVELQTAFERERKHQTIIVPLILCDMFEMDIAELKPFNPLPSWGRSWRSFEMGNGHTMDAHMPIRKGLWNALERVQQNRRQTA